MNREKLSQAIGAIDTRYIIEAAEAKTTAVRQPQNGLARFWKERRVAACICIAVLALSATFCTAFAASASFRKTVISVFFPAYSNSELKEIDEGHRTGSFDREDTLFTFLDQFNDKKMEGGLTAKKSTGYHYTFLPEQNGTVKAIVDCSHPDCKLLVLMKRKPYKGTTGLWQVTAYQIIDSETAESLLP